MKAGKLAEIHLNHGGTERSFKDVMVRHPVRLKHNVDGKVVEEIPLTHRWELEGTEFKQEATGDRNDPHRIVETHVIVGFLPEHVIE